MKKIFLFGRITRFFFITSFVFVIYVMIDMCIQSSFNIKHILLTLLVVIFVVFGSIWIYSLGLCINYKKDRAILVLGLSKANHYERVLSNIESIDIEKELNIGFIFIIKYKNGYSERIRYNFYRISIVEEWQFNRLKRQIKKLKLNSIAN